MQGEGGWDILRALAAVKAEAEASEDAASLQAASAVEERVNQVLGGGLLAQKFCDLCTAWPAAVLFSLTRHLLCSCSSLGAPCSFFPRFEFLH